MSNAELSVRFFLQLACILLACRVVSALAIKLRQPPVVGEMIAGVLIGPSLFGLIWPAGQQMLFPKPTMPLLYAISHVGLVLYMFLVGLEFNTDVIRQRIRSAVAISLSGIIAPFTLGGLLALALLAKGGFFTAEMATGEAVLYLGASMSITAFPMLARILYERNIAGTRLGTLTLAAGAIDDATAWCLLAVVLAIFNDSPLIAVFAIGGGVLYTVVTLTLGRRLMARLGRIVELRDELPGWVFTVVLIALMLAAWFTDAIGIYSVFGAFILGIATPRGAMAQQLEARLHPLTGSLLLPLFFVYSGLNTKIALVNTPYLWMVTLGVVLCATLGKGVACWFTARLGGASPSDAVAIGALMNARGLMELIILNIGLEKGLITPTLFSIMVIMAITTTVLTSPVFDMVYSKSFGPQPAQPHPAPRVEFEPTV